MRELTPQQQIVAKALGMGRSQVEAADEAKCDRKTIQRWLADTDGLGAAMGAAIRQYANESLGVMMGLMMRPLRAALEGEQFAGDMDAALRAADVVQRRMAAFEKAEHNRATLDLQREALAAKATDESKTPDGIGVLLPQEDPQP